MLTGPCRAGSSGSTGAAPSPIWWRAVRTATLVTHKLLSENPERYRDAAPAGHPRAAGRGGGRADPGCRDRRGQDGHDGRDQRAAGAQGRAHGCWRSRRVSATRCASATRTGPKLFARHIVLPELLYERVVEVDERVTAEGEVLRPARSRGRRARISRRRYRAGHPLGRRSCSCTAIAITAHERRRPTLAREWASPRSRPAMR